ncbi:YtxH domain-containing protein [Zunongwangia sp. F260]|uniref:YtxH domain-containing protein n=2 Tax=Autumnicola TaxID=3160927 RepID=A0ABU3CLL3_9FLAO|nr:MULTISPECIES: YtxH domain-containing protein [unclassified Zunongwangia]MDT0647240.1 YtxH domain-containing protein [Zunongwangia sp. F260]MDT0685520.1 YtxH domain-containing protein [Zunongwangia sp. F225]
MANTGSTLLALITGAAIGAGVGLLYAPGSGEETRKKIKKDAEKAQKDLNKRYKETSSNLTEKAKKARTDFETRLEETLSSASYKADDILSAMESKLEELRKQNARLQKDAKSSSSDTSSHVKAGDSAVGGGTTGKAVV